MATPRKKVGITGAAGNVGTTLRRGLAPTYDLTLYDLKPLSTAGSAGPVQVDFAEREQVAGIFDGLDALVHLAGDPRPDAPRRSIIRNNFLATSLVFEEARRAGVKKIVFASSNFYHQGDISRILAEKSGELITLDHPATPRCPYGESKVYGENIGRHLACFGVRFAALRIGWTVPQDNPALYGGPYMRAVFCSHRDLVAAFGRALEIERDFLVAFAVSNNRRPVFDLDQSNRELGMVPLDDAENYF